MEVIFEPQLNEEKRYECFACKVHILEDCHMCENCYNFFFCSKCYVKKESFKSLYANNHKKYHVFTKIF
jgi:mRNA (2'-O-methyladenosine-N6-)-methyltransferase